MKRRLLFYIMLICCMNFYAQDNILKFNTDGKFKIVQFTDIHWVPGYDNTDEIRKGMEYVLDVEKPDLVVFTGDYINGQPVLDGMKEVFAPVVARKIPFATTFGNHDDEQGVCKKDIFDCLQTIPGNLTTTVEGLPGMSNYVLEVKASKGNKNAALLYCFDSHSYSDIEGFGSYGWIKPEQVRWYSETSALYTKKNNGKPYPSLAFFHIPIPEYNMAVKDEKSFMIGVRKEPACSPEINTGLFAAIIKSKDVMGTFVGHDHVNDYATIWKNIVLAYGRFSGSDNTYHEIPGGSGARIIELVEGKRIFNTWIRLYNKQTTCYASYPDDFIKKN